MLPAYGLYPSYLQCPQTNQRGTLLRRYHAIPDNDVLGQTLKSIVENQQILSEHLRETVNHILETSQMVTSMKTEIQSIEKLLTSAEGTSSSMAEMQASVEEVGMNIGANWLRQLKPRPPPSTRWARPSARLRGTLEKLLNL